MERDIIQGLNSYLTFQLGSEKFAVNIGHVKKILELSDVTKVPHVPDYYMGVINLFGDVLPVICTRKRFGMELIDHAERTCIIVLMMAHEEESFSVGIVVDQVHQVLQLDDSHMKLPPDLGKRFEHDFIKSIANINDEFIIVLDVDSLFNENELELISTDNL